jgi:hypothetical protein
MRLNTATIALTGLNVADNPQPGLSVGRCLLAGQPSPRALIGITYDLNWTAVHASDVFQTVYLVPPPWLDAAQFVDGLLRVCREARVTGLVPLLEADVTVLARHRAALAAVGLRVIGPTQEMLTSMLDFWRSGPGDRMNVLVPRSAVANAPGGIAAAAASVGYPLLLCALSGETASAASLQEAQVIGGRFFRWWGGPLVLRAHVPGEEYQVAAVARGGILTAAVAVKTLAQGGNGSTWAVVTVADNELLRLTRALVRHLHWTGALTLKFVKESWSARVWLIGSSPCLPVWVGVARAVGQNLPALALRAALAGKPAPAQRLPDYKPGVMLALTSRDEISDVSALAALGTTGKLVLNGHATAQRRVG